MTLAVFIWKKTAALDFPVWWRVYNQDMENKIIKVELLYFDGCPSYKRAWADLLDVAVESNFDVSVRPRHIDSVAESEKLPFAGSPTILINGRDLENYQAEPVMACRIYQENDNNGWPSKDLLKRALQRGRKKE